MVLTLWLLMLALLWAGWFTCSTAEDYFQRVGVITVGALVFGGLGGALVVGWRILFPS